MVHALVRQYPRHRHRVGDEGLAGLAFLPVVRVERHPRRVLDLAPLVVGQVPQLILDGVVEKVGVDVRPIAVGAWVDRGGIGLRGRVRGEPRSRRVVPRNAAPRPKGSLDAATGARAGVAVLAALRRARGLGPAAGPNADAGRGLSPEPTRRADGGVHRQRHRSPSHAPLRAPSVIDPTLALASFGGERPQQCAPRVRSRVGSGARVERRGSTSRSLALNPAAMWTLLRRPLASDPRGREAGGYPRYDREVPPIISGPKPPAETSQTKNRHRRTDSSGFQIRQVSPTTTNSRRRRRGKSNPNVPLPRVVATVRGAASRAAEPSGHLSVNAG